MAGCTEAPPSGVQSELELGQYTQAVDQSTRQDTMHDPAKLMVQLETALASYHFKEVVKIARTIDQLALAQDNPIRLRAKSLQLSAEAMLDQLKQVEGTYQIERSTLDTGLKERSFPATGQIDVSFAKRDGLVATIDYQDFGMIDAPRNDTESIRFEPDLSARLAVIGRSCQLRLQPIRFYTDVRRSRRKIGLSIEKNLREQDTKNERFLSIK